jgi:hypothetical protein
MTFAVFNFLGNVTENIAAGISNLPEFKNNPFETSVVILHNQLS